MSQGSAVSATTDGRRFSRALRPLLLLGGFVILWWCLATGTAQAADGPHHGLGDTTPLLSGTVRHAVGPVRHTHEHQAGTPHHVAVKVSNTVRHQVVPVVGKVQRNTVTNVVTTASSTLRSQVAPVLKQLRKTVASGPQAPGPVGRPGVLDAAPLAGESAALQGQTHSSPLAAEHFEAPAMDVVRIGSEAGVSAGHASKLAVPNHMAPLRPSEDPQSGLPHGTPVVTASAPASSGTDSGPGVAVIGPAGPSASRASKTSITSPAGWPTAAPAYAPSSSPD